MLARKSRVIWTRGLFTALRSVTESGRTSNDNDDHYDNETTNETACSVGGAKCSILPTLIYACDRTTIM